MYAIGLFELRKSHLPPNSRCCGADVFPIRKDLRWSMLVYATVFFLFLEELSRREKGTEKAHKLFQHKLFGPHPKHPILAPEKKVYVPHPNG